MTLAETIVEAIKREFISNVNSPSTAIRYPVNFEGDPDYDYFFQLGSGRGKNFLCTDKGGQAVFRFGIVANNEIDCVTQTEAIIDFVKNYLIGDFLPISIYNTIVGSERDITEDAIQVQSQIYHKVFDVTFFWNYTEV